MKKKVIIISLIILSLLLVVEVVLRKYGFGHMLLVKEDENYEYIAVPNQDIMRFGNHIFYNSFGMRAPEPSSEDSIRILGLGDSVINGGTLSDQDSIATSILSKELTKELKKRTTVLNISAGSWGPDNVFAYIKKNGDFNAKLFFLVVSSHDARDNMDFEKIVDISPDFPSHQYPLAMIELWDRYLWPRYIKPKISKGNTTDVQANLGISKKGKEFNTGFKSLAEYSQAHKIPLIVYLHPEQYELQTHAYNNFGKEIIHFCDSSKISLILGMNSNMKVEDYRDNIHLNEKGQRKLATVLLPYLTAELAHTKS